MKKINNPEVDVIVMENIYTDVVLASGGIDGSAAGIQGRHYNDEEEEW